MSQQQESARERFAAMYADGAPPWEIGRPQRAFLQHADEVTGRILDVGCGTGELAMYFAARGHDVTGIDIVEAVIETARQKAVQRGLSAQFLARDALTLEDLDGPFDSVIDCGLFHTLSDSQRPHYVQALKRITPPGGRLMLMCFSEKEPGTQGPRRITQQELRECFSAGWIIDSLEESRFEVRPDSTDLHFSPGGPFAWFCILRRTGESLQESRTG